MKRSIEIEKKVLLDKSSVKRIENLAKFIEKKVFADVYYDTEDIKFTLNNIWIRKRENVIEVKVGIHKKRDSIDRYEEISDPAKIIQLLNLQTKETKDLEILLQEAGIQPFCTFTTSRKRYRWNDFHVDLDVANCDSLTYCLAEFEIIVSSLEEARQAERKLKEQLLVLNLQMDTIVPAKLSYFLYHQRVKHYEKLVANNVIAPIRNDSN